jgi:hypothetical protein
MSDFAGMVSNLTAEPVARNKGGRPRLDQTDRTYRTSVSLKTSQRIEFLRLGGSKWLREQIDKAKDGHDEE